jgi:hypothetical protein
MKFWHEIIVLLFFSLTKDTRKILKTCCARPYYYWWRIFQKKRVYSGFYLSSISMISKLTTSRTDILIKKTPDLTLGIVGDLKLQNTCYDLNLLTCITQKEIVLSSNSAFTKR